MFYTYSQNNSGGSFDFDESNGLTHFVIIEAESLQDSVYKALDIGIYFNGVDQELDCPCCGDRWYEPWDEGSDQPLMYGESPEEYVKSTHYTWMDPGKEVCVHYLDGTLAWY